MLQCARLIRWVQNTVVTDDICGHVSLDSAIADVGHLFRENLKGIYNQVLVEREVMIMLTDSPTAATRVSQATGTDGVALRIVSGAYLPGKRYQACCWHEL